MIQWQICLAPVTGAENVAWIGVMLASVNWTSTRWINPIMGQTCREKIHLNLVMLSRAVFNSFGPIWGWCMSVGEHSSKGWPWAKCDVLGCGHSCEAAACWPTLMVGKPGMTKRCTPGPGEQRCVNEPIRKIYEAERGSAFPRMPLTVCHRGLGSSDVLQQDTLKGSSDLVRGDLGKCSFREQRMGVGGRSCQERASLLCIWRDI